MNNLLKTFNDAEQAIYDHVGFVEGWTVYPISDETMYCWKIEDGELIYGDSKEEIESREGNCYSASIINRSFSEQYKSIYRGNELTLIVMDTHCDDNKCFGIFDNSKEIK
jgi:hypothetical protein